MSKRLIVAQSKKKKRPNEDGNDIFFEGVENQQNKRKS